MGEKVEKSGRVKWFDPAKGYGFVIDFEKGEDWLMHKSVLPTGAGGVKIALDEGAVVLFEPLAGSDRRRVAKVLKYDLSMCVERSPSGPKLTGVSGFEVAIVKWFCLSSGFGFLTRGEGTDDIFVHVEALKKGGLSVKTGDALLVRYGRSEKGMMAAEVKPLVVPSFVGAAVGESAR